MEPVRCDRRVVLLVDDEPAITAALRRLLRREPWEVQEAHSALEALALLALGPIDLILADEEMPGMSGSEFLARVRHIQPRTIRMILTGRASVEAAVRAINEGEVRRFFLKPCDEAELISSLREALAERDAADRAESPGKDENEQEELRSLEAQHPGITHLHRCDDGAIDLDDEAAA